MKENPEVKIQPKRKSRFLILFWLFLIIIAFLGVKYISYQKGQNLPGKSGLDQFSNIDSQIYNKQQDIAEPGNVDDRIYKQPSAPSASDEVASKDLYASIVKQQLQIDTLSEKYSALRLELDKIKNQDKLSKIIVAFVEVKDCIDARKDCAQQIEKLSLLAKFDSNLEQKISRLKEILKSQPKTSEQLKAEFHNLIPQILTSTSTNGLPEGLFEKFKRNIGRLFVIRRVDGIVNKSSENIDFVILETEKLISRKKYNEALNLLDTQDEKYKKSWADFSSDLKNANDLDLALEDIFEYLKSL